MSFVPNVIFKVLFIVKLKKSFLISRFQANLSANAKQPAQCTEVGNLRAVVSHDTRFYTLLVSENSQQSLQNRSNRVTAAHAEKRGRLHLQLRPHEATIGYRGQRAAPDEKTANIDN